MSNLRQEIIELFKLRADFIKWKLLIVSILAATGLGLTGDKLPQIPYAFLVLTLIPLVCLYVDLLCKHNSLRILVIGAFKRTIVDDSEYKYEIFAKECAEHNIFSLEEYAISYFTYAIAGVTILSGLLFFDQTFHLWSIFLPDRPLPEIFTHPSSGWPFMISGFVTLALTLLFDLLFRKYRKKILDVEYIFRKNAILSQTPEAGAIGVRTH